MCDVDTGVCVQCTLTEDVCPSGQHCTASNQCAQGCVTASNCQMQFLHGNAACNQGICVLGSCDPGYANCDGIESSGCEVDLETSPSNCGACNFGCSLLEASSTCTAGTCTIVDCVAGFADCDNNPANGCEVDTETNVNDCGGCGVGYACSFPNAVPTCVGGVCAIGGCAAGFADCDKNPANGCEVSKLNDPQNCNKCGTICTVANGTPACVGGICVIAKCDAQHADCDGDPSNGCEVNLETDAINCGACNNVCGDDNAMRHCVAGVCSPVCNSGYSACSTPNNGCDVQTSADVHNCGSCGRVCPPGAGTPNCISGMCGSTPCPTGLANCTGGTTCTTDITTTSNCGGCGVVCSAPNGTPACVSGACAVGGCNAGFADCDKNPTNGCETNTMTSAANCGGCGQACNLPHANAVCSAGGCVIASCIPPYADCNGVASDGCEINTQTDTSNCGACSHGCNAENGTPSCASGACAIACAPGFADCNASLIDGCETNTGTDPNHCGGCGTICAFANATALCSNGTCALGACTSPFQDCDGKPANGCETNTSNNTADCGACGATCSPNNGSPTCSGGGCQITCNPGFANCDGNPATGCESNLENDVANCGGCGVKCPALGGTPNCVNGMCNSPTCPTNVGDCSGAGCDTNLLTDPSNCGSCGNACTVLNGTGMCVGGVCEIKSCATGFGDCDGSYATGCEASLATNQNCGKCNQGCSALNAVTSCATGSCVVTSCTGTYANCDGTGCNVDTSSDAANCGQCQHACDMTNSTTTCVAGACTVSCLGSFADCDMNPANGCETNLLTNPLDCGACGRACSESNVASIDCNSGTCDSTCAPGYANCGAPMAPTPDDGCETPAAAVSASCGSCSNSCSAQGVPGNPLVCEPTPGMPGQCGCTTDVQCNLAGASGSCSVDTGGPGVCVCNGASCNPGEVCANMGVDMCSCNGGSGCGSNMLCCQTPAACIDPTSDSMNCGACGHTCPPGFACQASACVCNGDPSCNAGQVGTCAGGACRCGATACAAGQRCLPNGTCG